MDTFKYWNLVRFRIEKLQRQIRISQVRETFAEARLPPPDSPPYDFRPAFVIAGQRPVSAAEEAEARDIYRRIRAASRARREPEPNLELLRYSERRNRAGRYAEWPSEYAPAIYAMEMQTACALVRDGRGVWVQRNAGHEWTQKDGYAVESLPDELMLSREDRDLLARILEQSPGRSRGRLPVLAHRGKMTDAERKRRQRAKQAILLPQQAQPGITPSPQGRVPGTPFIEEVISMMARIEMNYAEYAHDRLGEIIERIARAPDDARVCDTLSRNEFVLLTAAGVLGMRLKEQIQ